MELTDAERALILTLRSLPGGYIEGLAVKSVRIGDRLMGQPGVLKNVTERVDLQSAPDRENILTRRGLAMLAPNNGSQEDAETTESKDCADDSNK